MHTQRHLGALGTQVRGIGWLAAGQVLLGCSLLAAQEVEPEPGTRVRVNREAIGDFVSWDANELVLSDTSLVSSRVTSVEVSLGRRSNAGKGALIGGLIGAAAGITYGLILCEGDCEAGNFTAGALFGAMGAGAGALVGLAIGLATKSEEWEEVTPLPVRAGYRNGESSVWVSLRL